ncbi:MAG TPA: hypothetical protein VJN88_10590 [Ktedonobacterales bacterium]|nr:hypothetical protein [Ktedonobacterales bacterium]
MDERGSGVVVIPLRDGTTLTVGEREARVGERLIPLSALEEARLTATQPETLTLRVQGSGPFEAQPANMGDGAVALEAIYRVRADLRPAASVTMPPPPGYPPTATYPPPGFAPPNAMSPGWHPYVPAMPPPGAYPPPYFPPLPGAYPPPPFYPPPFAQAANPNIGQGELTPVPRTFEQTLDAAFRLYFKHWPRWLALGLCVSLAPALLGGAAQLIGYHMLGLPNGTVNITTNNFTGTGQAPRVLFHFPDRQRLIADAALLLAAFIFVLIFSAWQTASLANGARDALLRRPVSPGSAVRAGLRRLGPTLGASLTITLIVLAALAPMFACIGVVFAMLPHLSLPTGQPPTFSGPFTTIALFSVLSVVFGIPGAILTVIFAIRLAFAPYIAATEELGAGAALRRSWNLTRGYFWRTFGIFLVAGLAVGAVTGVATVIARQFSLSLDLLVVSPLLAIAAAPFTALVAMTLLLDLRLRREGHAAVAAGAGGANP